MEKPLRTKSIKLSDGIIVTLEVMPGHLRATWLENGFLYCERYLGYTLREVRAGLEERKTS